MNTLHIQILHTNHTNHNIIKAEQNQFLSTKDKFEK